MYPLVCACGVEQILTVSIRAKRELAANEASEVSAANAVSQVKVWA